MSIQEDIKNILTELQEVWNKNAFQLLNEFISKNKCDIAVECICDHLVEKNFIVSERLSNQIQGIVSLLGMDPSRTWENLSVERENSHEKYRLSLGKDPLEIFTDIHFIWNEIRESVSSDRTRDIDEFISVGENRLAIEAICSAIVSEKIPISTKIFHKIHFFLFYFDIDSFVFSESVFSDKLLMEKNVSEKTIEIACGNHSILSNAIEEISEIFQDVGGQIGSEASEWVQKSLLFGEVELAIDIICTVLIRNKLPIKMSLYKKIKKLFVELCFAPDAWVGFLIENDGDDFKLNRKKGLLNCKKNFPNCLNEEKILLYITSIVNDPSSTRQRLSPNSDGWPYRPAKFIVDGVRDGLKIRVVDEPNSNEFLSGRGVLAAYTLE